MLNVPKDADQAPARLERTGYVPLTGLLTAEGPALLRREAARLEGIALRRDFSMACMDNSPRHMTTLGGQVIAEESELLPRLYADEELLSLLGRLTGQAVTSVPDPVERHVLNFAYTLPGHPTHRTDSAHQLYR